MNGLAGLWICHLGGGIHEVRIGFVEGRKVLLCCLGRRAELLHANAFGLLSLTVGDVQEGCGHRVDPLGSDVRVDVHAGDGDRLTLGVHRDAHLGSELVATHPIAHRFGGDGRYLTPGHLQAVLLHRHTAGTGRVGHHHLLGAVLLDDVAGGQLRGHCACQNTDRKRDGQDGPATPQHRGHFGGDHAFTFGAGRIGG